MSSERLSDLSEPDTIQATDVTYLARPKTNQFKLTMAGLKDYCVAALTAAFNNFVSAISSTSASEGASLVGVNDSSGFYAGDDVESVLMELPTLVQKGEFISAVASGTANAITAVFAPVITGVTARMVVKVTPIFTNSDTAVTFSPNGLTAWPIIRPNGALLIGDIQPSCPMLLCADVANTRWLLLNPASGYGVTPYITTSVAGGAITINRLSGIRTFRSPTLTSGSVVVSAISDLSLTVPSGATLGTLSGNNTRLLVLDIYNGGSPVLGIVNPTPAQMFDETGVVTTTLITGTSDSSGVVYSSTAVVASPYRIAGVIDIVETTAGVWALAPTRVTSVDAPLPPVSTAQWSSSDSNISTSTGATFYDVAVPWWATKMEVWLFGVSTSGTSNVIIQLGVTSATPTTSGYAGVTSSESGSSFALASNGFSINGSSNAAANVVDGLMSIVRAPGNVYVASAQVGDHQTAAATSLRHGTGIVSLSNQAQMLRLTTSGGTDTFDVGSFNVLFS